MSSSVTPGRVADAAVGDDPGPAAGQNACGQDVADRARARVAAGLHDQHVAGVDRLDQPLLGVLGSLHRLAHVGADGDVAQRAGVADHAQVRARRAQAGEERRLDAAAGELHGERRRRDLAQRGLGAGGRLGDPGRRRRRARRGLGRGRAGGKGAGIGGRLGHGPVGGERSGALDDRARHRARALERHLDDVAGRDDVGARRRAGEDHVAGLERHEPRQIGDELGEGEDEVGPGGVLAHLAVDGAGDVQRRRVHALGGHGRPDRREAVLALGHHVGAAVGPAEVVQPEVVGRRVPADVTAGLLGSDVPRPGADDHRDLRLEGEQLGAAAAGRRRRRPRARWWP